MGEIFHLYHSINRYNLDEDQYELKNSFSKNLNDGEIFIFDLINSSGEEDDIIENQAVTIISPLLNLPPFLIVPKVDTEGKISDLANSVLGWLVAKFGKPVEFPQFPQFEQRYLVSSTDPDETRQFLDIYKVRYLEDTRLTSIHAENDLFTLSHLVIGATPLSRKMMAERVHLAIKLFTIFQS